jgi:predicted DNA-binding transcriptional regulator AlpA
MSKGEEQHVAFLPARKVLERYSISDMSLYRWLIDPEKKFPKPYYIGRLRFWSIEELSNWEGSRLRQAPGTSVKCHE